MTEPHITPTGRALLLWIYKQHPDVWVNVDRRPHTSGLTIKRLVSENLLEYRLEGSCPTAFRACRLTDSGRALVRTL